MRRPAHVSGDVSTANGPDNDATPDRIGRGDASGSLVVNTGEMTRKRAETKTRNYYKLPFIHSFRALSNLPHLWYNSR